MENGTGRRSRQSDSFGGIGRDERGSRQDRHDLADQPFRLAAKTPRATARAMGRCGRRAEKDRGPIPRIEGDARAPRGGGEDEVSVEIRMGRKDRLGETGMTGDRQAFGGPLVEDRVGRDDPDRGIGAGCRVEFRAGAGEIGGTLRWQAVAAEFVADLEGRGPEMRTIAHQGRTDGIDGDESGDGDAILEHHRGGAEAACAAGRSRPEAGTDPAEPSVLSGLAGGAIAKVAIRRRGAPILRPAIGEIEENRRGNDRHAGPGDRKAAPGLGQARHHARSRFEAEGRTAGEHQGVDAGNGVFGRQKIGLARAGRAPEHGEGGDGRLVEQENGRAGFDASVVGMADRKARNVKNMVARPAARRRHRPEPPLAA